MYVFNRTYGYHVHLSCLFMKIRKYQFFSLFHYFTAVTFLETLHSSISPLWKCSLNVIFQSFASLKKLSLIITLSAL